MGKLTAVCQWWGRKLLEFKNGEIGDILCIIFRLIQSRTLEEIDDGLVNFYVYNYICKT
jgi:hypothetical protein